MSINLNEYFQAVGLGIEIKEDTPRDLTLLKQLIRAHLQAFPYQNTELFREGRKERGDRTVFSIDIHDTFNMMVRNRQPGYCFHNSELLAAVLTELGFKVTKRTSNYLNVPHDTVTAKLIHERPALHVFLVIELPNQHGEIEHWMVDPGFSNFSPRGPLKIKSGDQRIEAVQEIERENHRFRWVEDRVCLEIETPSSWNCLCSFSDTPISEQQLNDLNQQLFKGNPDSRILTFLKLARVTDEKRKFVLGMPGDGGSYVSQASLAKKYHLKYFISPDMLMDGRTLAVRMIDNELEYLVKHPASRKMDKQTKQNRITQQDLQMVTNEQTASNIWESLQGKTGDELLNALELYLPQLLKITMARGDTHKKTLNVSSTGMFAEIAKRKFGITVPEPLIEQALSLIRVS